MSPPKKDNTRAFWYDALRAAADHVTDVRLPDLVRLALMMPSLTDEELAELMQRAEER